VNKLFQSGKREAAQNLSRSYEAERRTLHACSDDLAAKADFCIMVKHHMSKHPNDRFSTRIQLPDGSQRISLAIQSLASDLQAKRLGSLLSPTVIARAQADTSRPPSVPTVPEEYGKVYASQWARIESCFPRPLSEYIPSHISPKGGIFTQEDMYKSFPYLIVNINRNPGPWIPRYPPRIGSRPPRRPVTRPTRGAEEASRRTQRQSSNPSSQRQFPNTNTGAPRAQTGSRQTGTQQTRGTGQRPGQNYFNHSSRQ